MSDSAFLLLWLVAFNIAVGGFVFELKRVFERARRR